VQYVTFHFKGLIVFFLFLAALSLALVPGWGILAAGCVFLIEWVLLFAGGWGRGRPVGHSRSAV
jgi:hypothetical protein